ncbi:MAG: phosphoribosylformylglycinamidine synthase subunit PurQ [Deltaproteobacteria bacterium]|nr:phosphoribosylformylglycinamidine synthase subunit PurQ [Deltaproteobacteria bacterium]
MKRIKALVLTGFGLNCDYETDFSLKLAGAESHRIHINELIGVARGSDRVTLGQFQILVFGGGFSWADDHGAGVLMAAKLKRHLGAELKRFVRDGNLVIGICNGFQALVNLGLLPGFDEAYDQRLVAITYNDAGNFVDAWVTLRVNEAAACVFTKGLSEMELPVRHGEGKVVAEMDTIKALLENRQVVMQYAGEDGTAAQGKWPFNPNGSIQDIAGICDPTGRVFGLMPHPEAFNHFTNHPNWTNQREALSRQGKTPVSQDGEGIRIFQNAVEYLRGR